MKKVFVFAFFLIALVAVLGGLNQSFFHSLFYYSICSQPINYRIDTVDPKFNLSRDEFLSDIKQAVQIWNNSLGKKLFVYDPKGDLSVNLIYDDRQSLTSRINQLENQVQSEKQSLKPQISRYQSLAAGFKTKLNNLNAEIMYWNKQGGAPPEQFQKIIAERQALQLQANELNSLARSLNLSNSEYNLQVDQLNQTIISFSQTLEERPEEGIFKGREDRIEIYFNISQPELVHTLAHELGHAIGLAHVNNREAIMYAKTSRTITPAPEDITALQDICQERSLFNLQFLRFFFTGRNSLANHVFNFQSFFADLF